MPERASVPSEVPSEVLSELSPDRIAAAMSVIDPVFLATPQYLDEQLCTRLGRRVLAKVETLNPLRSFKGRGAECLLSEIAAAGQADTVVCASGGGNFGQAIGYAASRRGLAAEVFVGTAASRGKLDRMTALGARVHPVDGDLHAHAEAYAAAAPNRILVVDGRDAAIAEGAGTIGIELLADDMPGGRAIDTIVVPVGDAALITGVARWVKAHAPLTRIVGAVAAAAPALARSWRDGEPHEVVPDSGFAAGIAIHRPHQEAVRRVRALVDDMVLVTDEQLTEAMRLIADTLGVLVEPAGAAGIAAIANHDVPGELVATVLTGANADPADFAGPGRSIS